MNASISGGVANFTIKGEQNLFNNISGTPKDGEWTPGNESEISINPDNYGINNYGLWADDEYDEGIDQSRNNPIIQWNRNITMPLDMNDYIITSADVRAIFNGSADINIETPSDTLSDAGDAYAAEYDHVRYYVLISDLKKIEQYEVAYNQTVDLGIGDHGRTGTGGANDLDDTEMTMVDEEDLVFYLNRILERDHQNFTITLGTDIYCEDNYEFGELDTWYYLYIKSCNLTFNYTKKIDQFTSISWKQDGQKISNISSYPVVATGAKLNFKYRLDKNWTITTSDQNSEINIYLNSIPYAIPIKLSDVNSTSFEEITIDLTPPSDSVNLTIELFLREDFILDQPITFIFDNVTLEISYNIYKPDPAVGNGGKRKVIRGPDYTPIVIGLTAGLFGLIIVFAAYQMHYKYPPIVRKIKKLKKNVRKGRKTKPLLLNKREELTTKRFTKQMHQIIELEKIQSAIDNKELKVTNIDKKTKLQKVDDK